MDTHSRETSTSSSLSDGHSFSDDFSTQVKTHMDNTSINTDYYVRSANKHLEEMAKHPNLMISLYGNHIADAHSILAAMLEYAPKGGRRYVACAIISCGGEVANQIDLAKMWLCYLLLPIKVNSWQRSHDATDETTPWLEMQQGLESTSSDFRTKIMHRDGFQCIMTGVYDFDCKPELQPRGPLDAAHIVEPSLAIFNEEAKVASVTWEIIRQYTNWSVEQMSMITDMPGNGFTLQKDFHSTWDMLAWTLVPKEDDNGLVIPNTYSVEVLERSKFPTLVPFHDTITFIDHSLSDEERVDEKYKNECPKPTLGVPLPHPEFIAFHRAIANVLHMSGAAQAIDLTMDWLHRAGSPVKAMDTQELMLQLSSLHLMDNIYQDR